MNKQAWSYFHQNCGCHLDTWFSVHLVLVGCCRCWSSGRPACCLAQHQSCLSVDRQGAAGFALSGSLIRWGLLCCSLKSDPVCVLAGNGTTLISCLMDRGSSTPCSSNSPNRRARAVCSQCATTLLCVWFFFVVLFFGVFFLGVAGIQNPKPSWTWSHMGPHSLL